MGGKVDRSGGLTAGLPGAGIAGADRPGLVLLVHSPLLGPYTWAPVAELLGAEGRPVAVPDLRPALTGLPPYHPRLRDAAAAHAAGRTVTLVGHSAAGPVLPAIAEALGPIVRGAVFVDARLPHPGASWLESVGPQRADRLSDMVTDGMLAPWDGWFPVEGIASQVPDPDVRERFRAELRPTPFALCEEPAPSSTPVFDRLPRSYLRLSPAYDAEADAAERAGWPVVRLDSVHLGPLSHAAEVAAALREILTAA